MVSLRQPHRRDASLPQLGLHIVWKRPKPILAERSVHVLLHLNNLASRDPVVDAIVILVWPTIQSHHVPLRLDNDPIVVCKVAKRSARVARTQSRSDVAKKYFEKIALTVHG